MKIMIAVAMNRAFSSIVRSHPTTLIRGFVAALAVAATATLAAYGLSRTDVRGAWDRFATAATTRVDPRTFPELSDQWRWSPPVVRFDDMYGTAGRANRLDWIRETSTAQEGRRSR